MKTVSLLAALSLPLAASREHDRMQRKLDAIEQRRLPRGSVTVFTPREINAWAEEEVPKTVPRGLRQPRVELGWNSATGYALCDFLAMQQGHGQPPNWFLSRLIEGERPVTVSVGIQSAAGQATVSLRRVEISGVAATGTALDFLVKTFFLPLYPDAQIDRPFRLDYDIDRLEVRPDGVRVILRK